MFPPEIFTEIFCFLASEPRILVTCSQAHPTFARLIEPTLYAHVIVQNHDANLTDGHHLKFKPNQLSTLLSDNPRILNYLRSLCVYVDLFPLYTDDEESKHIIAILAGLRLERIQLISARTVGSCTTDWQHFPIQFRTAFVACISTSSMKDICLENVYNIPLGSFADCAGLKRLKIWFHVAPPSNSSSKCPQLEVLELFDWAMDGRSPDFFSWALTHACGLHSLTLTTPLMSVIRNFLPHFLGICSTSLVNLSICCTNTIPPVGYDTPIEIVFPGLPSLERLRICTYTDSFRCPPGSDNNLIYLTPFTIAQKLLQNLSSLKHLTLIICLQFRGEDTTQVDWSPLADFVLDRLPSLQHTDLYIRAMKAGGAVTVSSDEANSMLSRCKNLTGLVEAGYVSIKEEMDSDDNRFFNESMLSD